MRTTLLPAALLAGALPLGAAADGVTDALDAARAAYAQGDVSGALTALGTARALLERQRAESLADALPPAPGGWTRELDFETTEAMATLGGGSGVEATYAGPSATFTVKILADGPMLLSMAPVLGNPELAPSFGGSFVPLGGVPVLEMDGRLQAMIGERYLIEASGADPDVMAPVFGAIDFQGLAELPAP
ncbi:hypothetical protein [Poseidonocella sp. HB161398]|uniref:hypothetical protein n=1 Tax=Poseidonocella sp. HB161398 TaxID=2320855 RepID=UPI001107B8D0|nr:hypothetical protein [Poseidonocella sp. HB161398]